ncbi:hypothetical protein [Sinorhizobium mexicanum]|uniref:Uncharacterized protein n=1 Tax=Sinorhizobium mexicanum TaxID=375549 RepID=A0A859QUD9_9HYPH|nr:hypothetical protein [Sinorhizobium mexicanum]MBP1887683.1 hypothetical protein [Sinorhizobium mexicanum]QLL62271.1 hypothetical protein FKV68_12890 [Sinorhizobium mexicanum]
MSPSRDFQTGLILPADIDFLQGVFNSTLEAKKLPCTSPEAEALAKRLFSLYQAGVRSPAELSALVA